MEQVAYTPYLGWVIWLGFAITGDAFISTISQFHNQRLTYRNWAGALALTHSTFPALSFIVFALLASISEFLSIGVSLFGSVMILLVVHEMLSDAFGTDPVFSLSDWIEDKTPLSKHVAKHTMKVLAVSWDALSLGPLLVLQSHEQQWDVYMTVGVFVIFGVIVGGSLAVTLWWAATLRERHFSDVSKLTKLNFYGTLFEVSVIASFAITLLLEVVKAESALPTPFASLAISLVVFTTVFATNREVLWENANAEAIKAVQE